MHAHIPPAPFVTHISMPLVFRICLGSFILHPTALAQRPIQPESSSGDAETHASSTIVTEQSRTSMPSASPGGLSLFMGISAGPLFSLASSSAESDKSGFMLLGKGLASLSSELWIIDGGVGWLSAQLNASKAGKDEYPKLAPGSDGEFIPGPVKIVVNAGLIELALRYRLTSNWQIGVIGNALLSTGDTAFSAVTADDETPTQFTGLVGGQVAYGSQTRDSVWQVGMGFLTDVTISERQVHMIAASLEFGIPIMKPEKILKEREIVTNKQRIDVVTKEKLESKVLVRSVLRLVFDKNEALFVNDGTKLHPDSFALFKEIGALAAAKNEAWTEAEIDPHLGENVPSNQSKRIREARFAAVRAALRFGGLDARKIKSLSPSRMVPDDGLSAGNIGDRIFLSFSGMRSDQAFIEKVRQLRKRYRIPETCVVEQGCQ